MHSLVHSPSHQATTRGHALGSPRQYDFFVEFFFLGRRRATFQTLIAAAGILKESEQRVLDVGCGTGYFVRLIAAEVGPGGLIIGIDPSISMVEYARGKGMRSETSLFQVGTAEALEFPDDHFDVVVSSLVMHHLPEDLRMHALTEMQRVLRPGGRVLVAEARSPQHGLGWRLLARLHGYDRMARQVPHLEPLARQAGFGEIRTGEVPPWIRYVVATKT
jgi:ubiquinone/menaquinone biosynthesis C-methylase UbiE